MPSKKKFNFVILNIVVAYCFIISAVKADKIESLGTTINGGFTEAIFRADVLVNGNSRANNFFEVIENIDVKAEIQVAQAHAGKTGYLYVVVNYNNDWYIKSDNDNWLQWVSPYAIETLIHNKGPKTLENIESVDVAKQFYGFPGSYQVFLGYKVDNELYFNAIPLKFVIQRKLNDTGIDFCVDESHQSRICSVIGFPGEDGDLGRDALITNALISKLGKGPGGFDFTKIAFDGKELPDNASDWSCIRDNVTGLVWEIKNDDGGLHDKDWRFSWYEPNNSRNGGSSGLGEQPSAFCGNVGACNTYAYVNSVNQDGWCGRKNWRMPTVDELTGIANLNRNNSSNIDLYFKDTHTLLDELYWSATPVAINFRDVWTVDFFAGQSNWRDKSNRYYVRLVSEQFR